jgi:hypothetical protein
MPDRLPVDVIDAATANNPEHPFPFDFYASRCLAQGDSWFSIGAVPPTLTTRIVAELKFPKAVVVVNCARPGKILRKMVDTTTESDFLNLLRGRKAMKWNAILLSGGGNDLIAAVGSGPQNPPEQRLLRTPAERGSGPLTGADYVSGPGWAVFERHIGELFDRVVAERDRGMNRGVPIVWHDYARVMPTKVGAGLGQGPWLLPALELFQVPKADRMTVSDELIARLGRLLAAIVQRHRDADPACNLHLVSTQAAGLVPADADAEGPSGDWTNEIHPSRDGYRKCARAWEPVLEPLLKL